MLKKWFWKITVIVSVIFILIQFYYVLCICYWKFFQVQNTSFMQEQTEQLQVKNPDFKELNYRWVDYDQMSVQIKRAVIASEDGKFSEHEGVDWDAIEKALESNNNGKKIKGGSTITQQLAKNLFLSGSRSYIRKAQELIITYMLEGLLSKQRILELYLNIAEWGTGIFGIEAASQTYFKIPAKRLNAGQAAKLASMLPNPRYYGSHFSDRKLLRKTRIITKRLKFSQLPEEE
jgi:monofunctional biosynthetic peptidoglycan transglycosylase